MTAKELKLLKVAHVLQEAGMEKEAAGIRSMLAGAGYGASKLSALQKKAALARELNIPFEKIATDEYKEIIAALQKEAGMEKKAGRLMDMLGGTWIGAKGLFKNKGVPNHLKTLPKRIRGVRKRDWAGAKNIGIDFDIIQFLTKLPEGSIRFLLDIAKDDTVATKDRYAYSSFLKKATIAKLLSTDLFKTPK